MKTKISLIISATLCIIIVLSTALFFVACDKKNDKEIVIATERTFVNIILNVMEYKDLLDKYLPSGYKTKYIEINGAANKRDAVVAGQVDFITASRSQMLPPMENGLPLAIVSSCGQFGNAIYSRKPNIKNINDLSLCNTIIQQSAGGTSELALSILGQEEFGNKDIFVAMLMATGLEHSEMMEVAKINDSYDAVVQKFPYTEHLLANGFHMVVDLVPTMEKYWLFTDMYTNKNMVYNNWHIVDAFLKAQQKAIDLLIDEDDDILLHLSNLYSIEKSLIINEIRKYPPSIEVINYDKTTEALLEYGMLTKPAIKFEDLFNYDKIPKFN